ncbi:MAG: transcriptional repressor [Chitinivibrionales bacterium]|nr:transcriptional repressor [Chitinivibrionales bacterium]
MQYRKSRQRERILQLLKSTDAHPTADWIYKKLKKEMPSLSLGTVYRNLRVLVELGSVKKLPLGNTYDRYEAKIDPHYHLVCEQCGVVQDFMMPQYAALNKKAEKFSTFCIRSHRIEFYGLCERCRNQAGAKQSRKNF